MGCFLLELCQSRWDFVVHLSSAVELCHSSQGELREAAKEGAAAEVGALLGRPDKAQFIDAGDPVRYHCRRKNLRSIYTSCRVFAFCLPLRL